jgi:signal transduction histidine kinase
MALSRPTLRGGLRTRLVVVTMLITALVVAAVVVLVQVYLAHVSTTDSTEVAHARADAVAATVRLERGDLVVLEAGTDTLDRDVWVFDAAGKLVEGRLPRGDAAAISGLGTDPSAASRSVGDRVQLVSRPVTQDGRTVAVVVAGVDLAPYEHAETRGLWLSLGLGLLTVVAAGVAAGEAARHTLGQVRQMVRSAQDWEEHDLDRRFDLGPPVDEIGELGRTLDHMLDRIAEALHTERRLSDEVAHELRTPLAVVRAEAELALATAPAALHESLEAIITAAVRLEEVVASMLDAARSRHDAGASCDAVRVLGALAAPRPAARPGAPEVVPPREPGPLWVAAPAGLVRSAVSPLLDNAVRHARDRVELTAARRGDRVVLGVLDDGPGLTEVEATEVFRPGHRGADGGSAGLGLAVVRRLVESVGGSVRACPDEGGRFEVELPAGD